MVKKENEVCVCVCLPRIVRVAVGRFSASLELLHPQQLQLSAGCRKQILTAVLQSDTHVCTEIHQLPAADLRTAASFKHSELYFLILAFKDIKRI